MLKSIRKESERFGNWFDTVTTKSQPTTPWPFHSLHPTFSILDWTKQEITFLDIATRKILAYTGSLQKWSDINRLYATQKNGGRGLTLIEDAFMSRVISVADHLTKEASNNPIINMIKEHKENSILSLGREFKRNLDLPEHKEANRNTVRSKIKGEGLRKWKTKPLHGYLLHKIEKDIETDQTSTPEWMNTGITSHAEGYVLAMQEQEIAMRAMIKRRQKDDALPIKCRLCKGQEQTVFHVLGSFPSLSSNLYTDHRHDKLGEIIVQEILRDNQVKKHWGPPAEVTKTSTKEIWWNQHIHTTKKKYNQSDIVVWEQQRKLCTIVELSVPLDFNVSSCQTSKVGNYVPLVSELHQMYQIVPIIIGALGLPKSLPEYLIKLNIDLCNSTIRRNY